MASADLPLLARGLLDRILLGGSRSEYLGRILAMDLPQAHYSGTLTQPPAESDRFWS